MDRANLKIRYRMNSGRGLSAARSQSGVALFISLVMLGILTVLGLSGIQSTSLQERMARNSRDTNLAFQAAESAVDDAESYLETVSTLTPFEEAGANDNGRYEAAAFNETPHWEAVDWEGSQVAPATTPLGGVAEQPKYIVEFMKTVVSEEDRLNIDNIGQDTGAGRTQMFRITARGVGGTAGSKVMLQATYGKKF